MIVTVTSPRAGCTRELVAGTKPQIVTHLQQ